MNRPTGRRGEGSPEMVDVHLVTKALGEFGRGPLGVVAGPVELMVDSGLYPSTERLEEGGGQERGGGDRDRLALDDAAEHGLEEEDRPGVDRQQHAAENRP